MTPVLFIRGRIEIVRPRSRRGREEPRVAAADTCAEARRAGMATRRNRRREEMAKHATSCRVMSGRVMPDDRCPRPVLTRRATSLFGRWFVRSTIARPFGLSLIGLIRDYVWMVALPSTEWLIAAVDWRRAATLRELTFRALKEESSHRAGVCLSPCFLW